MTTHIVHISTFTATGCEHCHFTIGGQDNLAQSVNHYIDDHGYQLLHVGAETVDLGSGLGSATVAVVGK